MVLNRKIENQYPNWINTQSIKKIPFHLQNSHSIQNNQKQFKHHHVTLHPINTIALILHPSLITISPLFSMIPFWKGSSITTQNGSISKSLFPLFRNVKSEISIDRDISLHLVREATVAQATSDTPSCHSWIINFRPRFPGGSVLYLWMPEKL